MAIPSLVSLEFISTLGRPVTGDELSAVTAQLISEQTGFHIFWWLTLLCGFLVLAPGQSVGIDSIMRRWTDLIWTGVPAVHRFEGHQVKYIYYGLLMIYWMFGLQVLIRFPNPVCNGQGGFDYLQLCPGVLGPAYARRQLHPASTCPQARLANARCFSLHVYFLHCRSRHCNRPVSQQIGAVRGQAEFTARRSSFIGWW
jgi:hypothetical protein